MKSKPPIHDQKIASTASAVDQCLKLGGVLLQPASKPKVGFNQ